MRKRTILVTNNLDEITNEIKLSSNNYRTKIVNKNFGKIAERFLLEEFSGKTSNDNQWINKFEKKCTRFEILRDAEKN